MKASATFGHRELLLFLLLAAFSVQAYGAIDNVGVLDNVLARYSAAAGTWGTRIASRATWMFWTLTVVSMVWTFGLMAIRKADLGEFYSEFVRFTLFTGFFWWVLSNGPRFATDIMDGLRQIGAEAAGVPNALAPSGIVDIGFDIFTKTFVQSDLWKPIDSAIGMVISLVVLVVFALIGVNMLVLLISGWVLAYAGAFFLGFGGSRWTSDMAVGYFKTVLNIAAQLLTMVLLVGIGESFVDQFYVSMSTGIMIKELAVMLVVAVILLVLVNKVPGLIGSLAGGPGTASLGGGLGAGAAIGSAQIAGAAMATAGAAIVAGAANLAGGTQALVAAFSKANAAESAGGAASAMSPGVGGTTGSGGDGGGIGSALAAAMGNSDGGASGPGVGFSNTNKAKSKAGGVQPGSANSSSGGEELQTNGPARKGSGSQAHSASAAKKNGTAPGEVPRGAALKAVGAMAAKAGRISGGTAANLALGSWDVAKAAIQDTKEGVMGRIGETVGGKIASAIASHGKTEKAAAFGEDSLSAGARGAADKEAEVAAFRDRSS
jgi:type IV secretion system protein VirB6/type IV secretion system protein TrbL